MKPSVGDRVVVRFRKGPGAPTDWRGDETATMSDVTGVLESSDPDLVVRRGDESLRVPAELVVAVRVLTDKPVRNSQIRSMEVAAARAWPGVESEMINGWLARAGGGFTRRANSAVPLEMGARLDSDTLDRLRKWYTSRDRQVLVAAVTRLIPGSHIPEADYTSPVDVLTAPIGTTATGSTAQVTITDQPSDEWVTLYDNPPRAPSPSIAREVLTASMGGSVGFAEIRVPDGTLVAIGRGAVTSGLKNEIWLGLSCLHTHPDHRGQGHARSIMAALEKWGTPHGATSTYLQVEADNTATREWYRRLGFGLHHSYGYVTFT